MNITYTYEIINVDETARCMEIIYKSDGRQTMHIGARLPYEGETTESIVEMYSPVALWREQEATVIVPEIGKFGSITNTDPIIGPPTAEQNKLTAERLLAETDWTQLPDVNLLNKSEYAVYREALRQIAINPVAGDLIWPVKPNSLWV